MLSVKRCRELLGEEWSHRTDEEIQMLREQLYGLAHITVREFVERQHFPNPDTSGLDFKTVLDFFFDAEQTTIEERAALIEFDGKLPRDEAERAAVTLTLLGGDN